MPEYAFIPLSCPEIELFTSSVTPFFLKKAVECIVFDTADGTAHDWIMQLIDKADPDRPEVETETMVIDLMDEDGETRTRLIFNECFLAYHELFPGGEDQHPTHSLIFSYKTVDREDMREA